MTIVDGCMVLPPAIFALIGRAKLNIGEKIDMREVFVHMAQEGLIKSRGVRSQGWFANVNDLQALTKVVLRIYSGAVN